MRKDRAIGNPVSATKLEQLNMRKSNHREQEIRGNAIKFDAYREAWTRIQQAQEHNFFLEAITIQESIISDRLVSFLSRPGSSNSFDKYNKNCKFVSFSQLIKCWQEEFPDGIKTSRYNNLIEAVNVWRDSRNASIHAIVKSKPGEATQPIDEFLKEAQKVAEDGTKLAKEVCTWHQSEKRKQVSIHASV